MEVLIHQIDATNSFFESLPRARLVSRVDSQESSAIEFTRSSCCNNVLIVDPDATSHNFTAPSYDDAIKGARGEMSVRRVFSPSVMDHVLAMSVQEWTYRQRSVHGR